MSRRARLFSEFLDESESGSRLKSAPTIVSSVQLDVLAKRRKTSGLNSRFDRMVETMNVTHRSPIKKSARYRAGSTSSASGSSVPKTPIDDYDEFHRDGRLGADFSVIKMDTSSKKKAKKKLTGVFPWDQDSSSDIIETTAPPPAPLPAWLANTFSTLTTKHPLRLLLPTQTKSESEPTPSRPRQVQVADDDDDSPFSFCAPADPMNASPPNDMSIEAESNHDAEPSTQSTQTPCPPSTEPAFIDRPSSLPDETFVPFSTPGPGSVASRSVVSDSMPSIRLPESTSVEFPPAFTPMPHIIHHERSYVNCAPSFVPQLQSTPAPQHCNASTETSIMYHDRENTTDNRPAWDPVLNHGAYIDIFSTPGPGCRAPTPVYFDSPTEHPSDSDPLQPGYELDSLDFRWEPFIQKAPEERVCTSPPKPSIGTPDPAPISNSDDYYYEIQVDPDGEDDADGQLYASINMAPTSIESPDPFSFAPPPDVMPTGHPEPSEQSEKTTATPERSVLPFFAPAPGIFISPLRGNEAAASPKPAGSTQAGDDGLGSQSSNDSIEDWDDTATD